ncbi:unnamed protein product, partial [Vitis vinifera]
MPWENSNSSNTSLIMTIFRYQRENPTLTSHTGIQLQLWLPPPLSFSSSSSPLSFPSHIQSPQTILSPSLLLLSLSLLILKTPFSPLLSPRRPKLKKGYVYGGSLDMCFDGDAMVIGRMIGNMAFEFENGVEIVVEREKMLADVGGGVQCLGIGRSDLLGVASNIIGNFHQQDLWVEFDLVGRRVGFGRTDCSRSV